VVKAGIGYCFKVVTAITTTVMTTTECQWR